jgi:L-ascorbate metabolism protein UlaG (beta-lactamase superfamily)
MKLTWLGHSCVLIEGKDTIIVDPFLSGNPAAVAHADDVAVDIVAVTHGHGDHFGDALDIAKRGATMVAIHELAQYASCAGVEAIGVNIGGRVRVGRSTITMVPAFHSSGLDAAKFAFSGGCAAGFIIESEKSVYHAGDTCLFSDMKLIAELYAPTVAFVPIGDRYTMGPKEAAYAASLIKASITIPIHYNTFPIITQDAEEFKRLAEMKGARVKILTLGEALEV